MIFYFDIQMSLYKLSKQDFQVFILCQKIKAVLNLNINIKKMIRNE